MDTGRPWFDDLPTEGADEPLSTDDPFVLEVRIAGATGTRTHHLRTTAEGYRFSHGPASQPDAWLTIAEGLAEALRAGTISVTAAVQSGRIRVGGDMAALLRNQAVLTEVIARTSSSG